MLDENGPDFCGSGLQAKKKPRRVKEKKKEACPKSREIFIGPPTKILTTDAEMGNGSSQSIVLGPPRFQQASCLPRSNGYHHSGVPKYVHPQNRVLPKPVAGQRLRSTDNGSILHAAGTIRGLRQDTPGAPPGQIDPEVMGALRRRSEMLEKENDCYHHLNLRNHRLFHSDPNIARRPTPSYANCDYPPEGYGNRRGCNGGAAGRASKLKYKKKARAPEPPGSGNSLPRQLERGHGSQDDIRNRNACKCIAKSRAPQPPSIVVHPPPPPPLPGSVTTRTTIGSPTQGTKPHEASSSVTRAVEVRESKMSYEKNVHPLEKWRNCRSTGDIRIDEQDDPFPSRTTVFDSKKIPDSNQTRPASYLPQRPDPFQKEIQMVTKKIAESRQQLRSPEAATQKDKAPSKSTSPPPPKPSSPPKFYFADPSVFKADNAKQKSDSAGTKLSPNKAKIQDGDRKDNNRTSLDEVVPSLERFSPGRQRFKVSSRNNTPTPQQKAEREWDHLSKSLYHKQDEDSKIDIRLRPVLPRKNPEPTKFSPSEAWQALGSDGLGSSNQSTSDDGRESAPLHNRGLRRMSDMDYRRYGEMDNNVFKHRSMSDSHWTPRQDLMDDSDVSSDVSDEAVVPRVRPGLGEISTRFSLPTVMFSNMRPIGTEIKSSSNQPSYISDKSKQSKKKPAKKIDPNYENNPAPNFKRFLSKRSKYLSEEDITVSDSNWTFGQYGLQKRGKQYSSELMLSDKKKYELMMKNNIGDFLGDILMSKSNHMRDQMKSSDSGNSNFSFYSTDGQIMYKNGFANPEECSPPTKGRVYDMRRRFDANIEPQRSNFGLKNFQKKKSNPLDVDLGRRRDLELAKMLEDEVRKRRNKEKISIRQQLQRMKNLHTDDEEDEFDDEAYFTEPKSREESQSPFYNPSRPHTSSEMGAPQSRFGQGPSRTVVDSAHLSHWQSSPALLEDSMMKNGIQPSTKGRLSLSSVMSSPDSGAWVQTNAVVDKWLRKQEGQKDRLSVDAANDGDVSSSPTPALPKKERRKTNIYKQLMDIVRKEERHLKKAQRGDGDPNSRDSSYSHRESSPSTSSETASTTSYTDSESSGAKHQGKNGVSANKEFGYKQPSAFHAAFAQPYAPNKSYRPVPFDVVTSASGYRLPGLQEEGKHVQAEVS